MKTVSAEFLAGLATQSADHARGRINHNLHPSLDDPIQRFFNVMEPGSYVRPHRHTDPPRWEVFVGISGRAAVLEFDRRGGVIQRSEISPRGPDIAVEIAGGSWHTVTALESGTVLFELKPGPYSPVSDKDFAAWAPSEKDADRERFVRWFAAAEPGGEPPMRQP